MHYLGLGGTSYRPKPGVDPKDLAKGGGQSHRLTISKKPDPYPADVAAISTMCGAIILLALGMAFADWVTRRDMRKKARNIVLASACFTEDGRILVKNDGTIPMQVIQTEADLGVSQRHGIIADLSASLPSSIPASRHSSGFTSSATIGILSGPSSRVFLASSPSARESRATRRLLRRPRHFEDASSRRQCSSLSSSNYP